MTDWKAYYRMFIKNLLMVVIIVSIFVASAYYISHYRLTPKYQATVKLFVLVYDQENVGELSYDNLMASKALVENYKELITSRSITSEVINKLNLVDLNDKILAQNISVELVPNSSMLEVSVRHENPAVAADIANELCNVFIQNMTALTKISNISIVDNAVVSEVPVSPRISLIVALSGMIGFFLALCLILLFVYLDDSIDDLKNIESRTGLNVIGIIPDMKKMIEVSNE